MKVLVYPHHLELGGSQLNAIELAAGVRDLGHEVVVYGQPGPLMQRIDELGLEFVPSPRPSHRPTPWIATHLRRLLRRRGIDIVHGYEWPPILEARLGVLGTSARAVGTIMSMAVADFIPTDLPLVVGTRQIAAHEERGRRRVTVIEPPVDLGTNNPDAAVDVEGFRRSHGIPQGLHVVVVCRLARELKLEGLLVAIEQVPRLSTDAVLTVVGDGPARPVVEAAAEQANAAAGRRAVVLTGEVADPRPAYAMADVALGMGGSALRALAFGAPLVVQGESGFWAALTADSLPQFQWTGWYGVGAGPRTGPDRLSEALAPLLHDARLRTERAQLALQVAQEHYSLARAAVAQEELYRAAAEEGRGSFVGTADLVGAGRFIAYQNHQRRARRAGRQHRDDFNGRPVAGTYSANATADADGRQSAVPR